MIAFTQFHLYTGQLWDLHLHVNAYYQKLLKQSTQEINASGAQNFSGDAMRAYLWARNCPLSTW